MSERSAVQRPMLEYAEAIGWRRVGPEEALALRGGDTGLYFTDVLREQLLALNPGIVDAARADDILRRSPCCGPPSRATATRSPGCAAQQSVFVPEENRELNLRLIDFDHPENNVFEVTDEWCAATARHRTRADVVFLINGIPVLWPRARTRPRTRHRPGRRPDPPLPRARRPSCSSPARSSTSRSARLLLRRHLEHSPQDIFNWKDEEKGNFEAKVKSFCDRATFLRLLRDYILFLSRTRSCRSSSCASTRRAPSRRSWRAPLRPDEARAGSSGTRRAAARRSR